MIMLAFSLTRVVPFNNNYLSLNLFGFVLDIGINFYTVIAFITAILAAAGSDWLIKGHPKEQLRESRWYSAVRHWIVPVLTSFVISITLNNMTLGYEWWVVFGLGSFLLIMVLIAEYNVIDIKDMNHPVATVGLTALSFALFLILAIAIRTAGLRLYLIIPTLVAAAGFVSLRTMYLRLKGKWLFEWAIIVALIIGQMAAGFYYFPVNPLQFGLFLLGILYALTSFISAYNEGRELFGLLAEPLSMLFATWLIGILSG
ncbi:MAG: hypothetical protein ABIG43_02755 [Chloroflexota bacterium]